jgi:hypothetical protein
MMARIAYELRASLCELLISWALKVCPKGYVPSTVEACVKFYKRGLKEASAKPS